MLLGTSQAEMRTILLVIRKSHLYHKDREFVWTVFCWSASRTCKWWTPKGNNNKPKKDFFNFLFCIQVQPVNNAVTVSGGQRRDSALSHTYACIRSPPTPSHPGRHRTLSRVPCAGHQVPKERILSQNVTIWKLPANSYCTKLRNRFWRQLRRGNWTTIC